MVWIPPLEQGLAYGLMALGVYIAFRILHTPDLTVDGSFPLGAAVAASMLMGGSPPLLTIAVAFLAGVLAGMVTGTLSARLGIAPLLSGIIVMTALYSVNLRIMGRPNIPLLGQTTLFRQLEGLGVERMWTALIVFLPVTLGVGLFLYWLLNTHWGTALRASGSSAPMANALGIDIGVQHTLGIALSNGLTAMSGALVAQHNGFADVNLGVGIVITGLASVILGEALLNGGIAKQITGVLLGSIAYRSMVFVGLRLGFPASDLRLATAALVVAALVLSKYSLRPKSLRRPTVEPTRAAAAQERPGAEEREVKHHA